jgi:hypothetical protein
VTTERRGPSGDDDRADGANSGTVAVMVGWMVRFPSVVVTTVEAVEEVAPWSRL